MNANDINSLFELKKDEVELLFTKAISNLQKAIEQKVLGFPLIEGGEIPTTQANLDYLQEVYSSLLSELDNSGYFGAVNSALEAESDVIKNLKRIYSGTDFPIEFNAINQQSFNILQNQKIDYLTNLSTNAITAIKQSVTDAVIGAVDVSEITANIRKELDEKLQRYASTYLETARGQLIQDAQDWSAQSMRDAGVSIYWEYIGPEDNKTREECLFALEKQVFTDEEKAEFQSGGLFPHDEPRWNCRHTFVMISQKEYNARAGESEERSQAFSDRETKRLNS